MIGQSFHLYDSRTLKLDNQCHQKFFRNTTEVIAIRKLSKFDFVIDLQIKKMPSVLKKVARKIINLDINSFDKPTFNIAEIK